MSSQPADRHGPGYNGEPEGPEPVRKILAVLHNPAGYTKAFRGANTKAAQREETRLDRNCDASVHRKHGDCDRETCKPRLKQS